MKDLKIIELRASNVMRLKAITIRPDGSLVILGGKNGQGKSSTLKAIEMLLGGTGAMPAVPVRRGESSAEIYGDLGDLVIERHISSKGTTLTVRNADGVKQTSPQKILDAICSKLTFDPLAFSEMKPEKQDAVLKQVLGLDFAQLDADAKVIYDQRAELNRAVKQHEARRDGITHHADAPAEEVSVAALTEELEAANAVERANEAVRQRLLVAECNITQTELVIEEIREQLRDLQKKYAQQESFLSELGQERAAAELEVLALKAPESAAIRERLKGAEALNRKVRENAERAKSEASAKEARDSAKACTEALDGIEQQKADMLAAAKFPVPGLSFGEVGPMLDGLPLEQASDAQRLRLSVAIGFALNPKLKVLLVRDGSRLDEDGMRLLAELAEEAGGQVFLERVGDKDPCAVVFEDGEIRDNAEAAAE